MSVFRAFELEAIRLLANQVLSVGQLQLLEAQAEFVSYDYSFGGYFLTVRHPSLPEKGHSISKPAVFGESGDILVGFILFLGKHRLTLECHVWGPVDVPSDFRDREVEISVRPVNLIDFHHLP